MKRILFLVFYSSLLISCGLFRKTTRERSMVNLNEKHSLQYVDTSVVVEQTNLDTLIEIKGTDETVMYVPIDYLSDSITQTIDNERYIATFEFHPNLSAVKARVKLKPINLPVKIQKQRMERKNISYSDHAKTESKQVSKQIERTPSVNWNWVIPVCLVLLLLFIILFIKF